MLVEPVEDSDKSPTAGDLCPVCDGDGVLVWQQPDANGVFHELQAPCPHGCGDYWTYPHAERRRVVPERDDAPARQRDLAAETGGAITLDSLRDFMTRQGLPPEDRA